MDPNDPRLLALQGLLRGSEDNTNVENRVNQFFARMGATKPSAITKARAMQLLQNHGINLGTGKVMNGPTDTTGNVDQTPFYNNLTGM